ncbi:hypothetical protein EDC01DRAFT_523686 [Geopyxis carbonaria]|nr:hypothetical protein EDC01DRAFT_523686 [Geopyxis carbonaria]
MSLPYGSRVSFDSSSELEEEDYKYEDNGSIGSMSVGASSVQASGSFISHSGTPSLCTSGGTLSGTGSSSRPSDYMPPQFYGVEAANIPRHIPPQPLMSCFFSFCGCRESLDQSAWIDHVIERHIDITQTPAPPKNVECYCGESFVAGDPNWNSVFIHIFSRHMYLSTDLFSPSECTFKRYRGLLEYLRYANVISQSELSAALETRAPRNQRRTDSSTPYYDDQGRRSRHGGNQFATHILPADRDHTLRGIGSGFPRR